MLLPESMISLCIYTKRISNLKNKILSIAYLHFILRMMLARLYNNLM